MSRACLTAACPAGFPAATSSRKPAQPASSASPCESSSRSKCMALAQQQQQQRRHHHERATTFNPLNNTSIDHHLPQIPPPSPRPHVTLLHRPPSPTDRAPRPLNIPIPPRNKASPSPHQTTTTGSVTPSHRRHRATHTHNHTLLPTKWRRLPRSGSRSETPTWRT